MAHHCSLAAKKSGVVLVQAGKVKAGACPKKIFQTCTLQNAGRHHFAEESKDFVPMGWIAKLSHVNCIVKN